MSEKKYSSGEIKAEKLEQKTPQYGRNNGTEGEIYTTEEGTYEYRGHESGSKKNNDKRQRTPGFGGWLAAVIALGVTTLVLGTMLTFGWINMNGMRDDMAAGTTRSLYELNAIADNLDANLSKARVASSAGDRTKIFTDIAIESELAESALERLPVDGQATQNLTSFINKVGESARGMLYTIACGKDLSPSQTASIEYMYRCNKEIKKFLNSMTSGCSNEEILRALDGEGAMFESFDGYTDPAVETPREIYDGPFAENTEKVSAKNLEGLEEITPERAEQLAMEYFAEYGAEGARCTGEVEAEGLTCLNIEVYAGGENYFAQLSKAGGKLVMFDSYKECSDKKFSVDNCITIAEEFLSKVGYKGMTAVWSSESGTACNLNFVYETGGAAVYPDMIKVKVCEERGIVTGIEALPYVLNHTERSIPRPAMSMSQARKGLGGQLDIETERLAIIPFDGGEKLAYEFCGTYEGDTYYVYLDADTGMQLQVFTVIGTAQGRSIM